MKNPDEMTREEREEVVNSLTREDLMKIQSKMTDELLYCCEALDEIAPEKLDQRPDLRRFWESAKSTYYEKMKLVQKVEALMKRLEKEGPGALSSEEMAEVLSYKLSQMLGM